MSKAGTIYTFFIKTDFDNLAENEQNGIINTSVYNKIEDIPLVTINGIDHYIIESITWKAVACCFVLGLKWYTRQEALIIVNAESIE